MFFGEKKIVTKFALVIHQIMQNDLSKIRKNPLEAKNVMVKIKIEKKKVKLIIFEKNENWCKAWKQGF